MVLQTGSVLNNRYRIVKLLGRGGFGAVYQAWDLNVHSKCALKENLDTSPWTARQFALEASLLANLRHANLPHVMDHFNIPDQGEYLVMQYIEGEDLQTMLEKTGGPLPEAKVLEWMSQVCDAVSYLHSRTPPIIHRDIKPANIRITPEGQAILVDFGVSKIFQSDSTTTRGAKAITPGYSPIEQYGQGATDNRTDIYALGATIYGLLAGHAPLESVQRNFSPGLPSIRSINPMVSPSTEQAINRAMAMLPQDRYQNVADFKADLRPLRTPETTTSMVQIAGTVQVAQPAIQPRPVEQATRSIERPPKKYPWEWMIGGTLGVTLILFLGLTFVTVQRKNVADLNQQLTQTVSAITSLSTSIALQVATATSEPAPTSAPTLQPTIPATQMTVNVIVPTGITSPAPTIAPTITPTGSLSLACGIPSLSGVWSGAMNLNGKFQTKGVRVEFTQSDCTLTGKYYFSSEFLSQDKVYTVNALGPIKGEIDTKGTHMTFAFTATPNQNRLKPVQTWICNAIVDISATKLQGTFQSCGGGDLRLAKKSSGY